MPHLPYSIELHDSHLARVQQEGSEITIGLEPAYIHRDGKGWSQDAEIIITAAMMDTPPTELPVHISDGKLSSPAGPYHNLLMLPLCIHGPVALELELQSGALLRALGGSIEVRLVGEPMFVEDVA